MDSYTKQALLDAVRADMAAQRRERRASAGRLDDAMRALLHDRALIDALADVDGCQRVVEANRSYTRQVEETAALHREMGRILAA